MKYIIKEQIQKKCIMYNYIKKSEQQIKEGKTKDARKSLSEVRAKYNL